MWLSKDQTYIVSTRFQSSGSRDWWSDEIIANHNIENYNGSARCHIYGKFDAKSMHHSSKLATISKFLFSLNEVRIWAAMYVQGRVVHDLFTISEWTKQNNTTVLEIYQ